MIRMKKKISESEPKYEYTNWKVSSAKWPQILLGLNAAERVEPKSTLQPAGVDSYLHD